MTGMDVLDCCRRAGVTVEATPAGTLKVRTRAGPLDPNLRALVVAHKPELLKMVGPCPGCRRGLDRGRCWWCSFRWCESCGSRDTGSCFLALCLTCEMVPKGDAGSG
jgi:hypothetical protein